MSTSPVPQTEEIRMMKAYAEGMKNYAKQQAKHIRHESFGEDPNKKKRNGKGCDRGASSGVARSCSKDYRQVYNQDAIRDHLPQSLKAEFCVCGKHHKACCLGDRNQCKLCFIEEDTANYRSISYSGGFEECSKLIMHSYPSNSAKVKRKSILKIRVNGKLWLQSYIKFAPFSSLLKTASPSGYKYRDRISLGKLVKMQGTSNQDLVFFITKDPKYVNAEREAERPVVNGVGFWGFMDEQETVRHIIQLNEDQADHVCFGFFIKKRKMNNIHCIQVDLESTKDGKLQTLTIWKWNAASNDTDAASTDCSTMDEEDENNDDDDDKTEDSNHDSFGSHHRLGSQSPRFDASPQTPSPCTQRTFQSVPITHGVKRKRDNEWSQHKKQTRVNRLDQRIQQWRLHNSSTASHDDNHSDSNHSWPSSNESEIRLSRNAFNEFLREFQALQQRVAVLESQRAPIQMPTNPALTTRPSIHQHLPPPPTMGHSQEFVMNQMSFHQQQQPQQQQQQSMPSNYPPAYFPLYAPHPHQNAPQAFSHSIGQFPSTQPPHPIQHHHSISQSPTLSNAHSNSNSVQSPAVVYPVKDQQSKPTIDNEYNHSSGFAFDTSSVAFSLPPNMNSMFDASSMMEFDETELPSHFL
eukprot:CAMPEP_0197073542 /NCGR_PEP_ID=MMETSP1384-20130603/210657_1 /TAXON_ID=29189 /ORGANISM="Ammonia sp." /LENGTH=634 /DNA_ID=CAMNT_0042512379 /DNA_START=452 /DNA_END=2356 /DNA_ORIENTATION=-